MTTDPGVPSSIPARSNIFMEFDHDMISMVILLPSADSFKRDCCQSQAKVCAQITGKLLVQTCPGKSVLGELTVAVDWDIKQENKQKLT